MTTLFERHRQAAYSFLSLGDQRAQRQLARRAVLVAHSAAKRQWPRIIPADLRQRRRRIRHRHDIALVHPAWIAVGAFDVQPKPIALDDLSDVAVEEL